MSQISASELTIVAATKDNALEIAKLHHNTWHANFDCMLPEVYLKKQNLEFLSEVWIKVFDTQINNHIVLLAKKGNNIVGFIEIGPLKDNSKILKDYDSEIYRLYIDNNLKRNGIGKLLMAKGLEYLKEKDFKKAVVKVFYKNIDAIKFYEKMGGKFLLQEELEDYHGKLLFSVFGYNL